ncbi:MAG: LamG domain-containing protein [Candidatus Poribacteria bacterium]
MKRVTLLFLVVFAGFFVINQSFSAMDGLVGLWTFDLASGTKVADVSGKGHTGDLVGSAKLDASGKFGSALSCDGTAGGFFSVPDNADFKFSGDFSIACWFSNNTAPADNSALVAKGYHTIPANGGDAKPWYMVYFLKAGTVDLFLRDSKAVNSRTTGKVLVNDGKWHHVVGLKAGNKVKVYIDGKEDGVADAVDAVYGDNTQPLVFMVHYDRWLKGSLDEVAIFNKALTEADIATVMKGLASGVSAVDSKGKLAVAWSQLK